MSDHFARIILLSHMRAFTSLAGHILGSHPQINGYYEMHISYAADSLNKQIQIFRESDVLKKNSRYIFDKLLHNDYLLMPEMLGITDIKILVSMMEPEQTIKSIVNLFSKKATVELYADPIQATKYYIDRIKTLAEFAGTARHPYYYYDAELFQAAPEKLLPKLTDWLELDSPLSEQYQIFSHTGKAGKGDSSNLIHSGKINRTKVDYSHIRISPELLAAAQRVYQECRQQIIDNATDSVVI
jgi:hypothetical protein